MSQALVLPPPPLSETCNGGADVSMVALEQSLRNQGRISRRTNDFSATINAGARSSLTNITGVLYNNIRIVGVSVSSEANTNWRVKFYRNDTGAGTVYNDNSFCGSLDITGLTSNANSIFEGDVEANLFYEDADSPAGSMHEIHLIIENTGGSNSKVFLTIFYTGAV